MKVVKKTGKLRMSGEKPENTGGGRKVVLLVLGICMLVSSLVWVGSKSNGDVQSLGILPVTIDEVVVASPTASTKVTQKQQKLVADVTNLVATASGEWAIWVSSVNGMGGYGINYNEEMEGASILKVAPMLVAWEKINKSEIDLQQTVQLLEEDRSPGSGPLVYLTVGTEVSWERLLTEMGKKSDNTGWRMLNRVLGNENIRSYLQKWGLKKTTYREGVYTTTAREVGLIFEQVEKADEKFKDFLRNSIYEDRITQVIPEEIDVVHKVGTLSDAWLDAGIVKCKNFEAGECNFEPFILVVLNKEVIVSEAKPVFNKIVQLVWEFEKTK